jgi:hypothetical protein
MFSAATPILWLNAVDNNFEYGTAGSAESSLDPEMVLFLAHPEECSPFFQRPSHIANYSVAETGPTLSRSMISYSTSDFGGICFYTIEEQLSAIFS